jgi:peptide/nickel transport system substrate-binding protein
MGRRLLGTAWIALAIGLAACAAPSSPQTTTAQAPEQQLSTPGRPLLATIYEPPALGGTRFSTFSAVGSYALLFGESLVGAEAGRRPVPRLVSELPSLDAGTWHVLPDNRMETTYRLRPGLTWHDGAPFTADDVIFTWQTIMTPGLPAEHRSPEQLIETIEAIDPQTFRIRWSGLFIYADGYAQEPLPKHILGSFLQDPQRFVNSPYWTTEWVGLGPYRLAEFVPGSHVKGTAFAGYALGAPRIEELYVHFVAGGQQAIAGVLAGTMDLPLGTLLGYEEARVLKQELEARGEGTVETRPAARMRAASIQFRDPTSPAARDVLVRRALVHGLDRTLMTQALHFGITSPADSFVVPGDAMSFARIDQAIAKYPYDPGRASQLLAQAGWTRGSDGVVRDAGGRLLSFTIQTTESSESVKEAQVAAESWSSIGISSDLNVVPRARQSDREYRTSFTGIEMHQHAPGRLGELLNWRTDDMPTPASRWAGENRGSYVNPITHQLAVDHDVTIDRGKRLDILTQLFKIVSEEVPTVPLYFHANVHVVRAGLRGVDETTLGENGLAANVYRLYWDR